MTTDAGAADLDVGPHDDEPHDDGLNNRLNWLRAGVLGANDGIVSTAGIVVGVAGATSDRTRDPGRRRRRAGRRRAEHGAPASTSRSAPSATPSRRCSRRSAASSREEPEEELAELAGIYVEQGAQRGAGAAGGPASSPSTTRSARTPRPSSASTPTTSPTRGTPPGPRCSSFTVGRAAAAAHDRARRPPAPGLGHRRRGRASPWRSPAGPAPGSATARRAGRCCATSAAACSRWRHLRDRGRWSAPRSGDAGMRMFVALVPPPEAVEHLDEFLEPRRAAGDVPLGAARAVARHAGLPRRRCADRQLDDLVERLGRAAARRTPFATRIAGGGAFPNAGRARVLWAGLDLDEPGRTELDRLATGARAAAVADRASRSTASGSGRTSPLARLGRPAEVSHWVRLLDAYRGPAWTADRIDARRVVPRRGPARPAPLRGGRGARSAVGRDASSVTVSPRRRP